MLFERDYEKAVSKENQDRIQKYIQGSDTRTVLDLGLFAEIKLNEKASNLLRTKSTKLEEVSSRDGQEKKFSLGKRKKTFFFGKKRKENIFSMGQK